MTSTSKDKGARVRFFNRIAAEMFVIAAVWAVMAATIAWWFVFFALGAAGLGTMWIFLARIQKKRGLHYPKPSKPLDESFWELQRVLYRRLFKVYFVIATPITFVVIVILAVLQISEVIYFPIVMSFYFAFMLLSGFHILRPIRARMREAKGSSDRRSI